MEGIGPVAGLLTWIIDLAVGSFWQLLTIQNVVSLVSTGIAIWKWWEAREANLYLRFERMIARYEHQLVAARSDLLDIMNRPGPGLLIRTPLFITWKLRAVLHRRKWHPASLLPLGQTLDRRLASALRTCDRKVSRAFGSLVLFQRTGRLSTPHPGSASGSTSSYQSRGTQAPTSGSRSTRPLSSRACDSRPPRRPRDT